MDTRALLASIAVFVAACSEPSGHDDDGGTRRLDARTVSEDAAPREDASAADDASPERDDASVTNDGGDTDAGELAPLVDCFGTRALHPTIAGGREWCLPSDPTREGGAWQPDDDAIGPGSEPGALLSDGSPRHSVTSLEGDAWWQNVEMTVYLRWLEGDASEEFTLYARGERHSRGSVSMSEINDGVRAPAGTETWPGYPFSRAVPQECLGTAYKASLAIDGSVFFKKEISHTEGYTDAAGEARPFPDGLPRGEWVGFKMILRNVGGGRAVQMEIWIDREADGRWELATSYEDRGHWEGDPQNDGCDEAPLSYASDQLVTWAGPIAVLRADAQRFEMREFSIREIAPLP